LVILTIHFKTHGSRIFPIVPYTCVETGREAGDSFLHIVVRKAFFIVHSGAGVKILRSGIKVAPKLQILPAACPLVREVIA